MFRPLIALTLLQFAFAMAPVSVEARSPAAQQSEATTYELLNLFGDVFERVRSDYVEEVTDEQLIEAALNGMLTDLDPHSGYLSKKSFQEMQVQTKGEFGGLGIEVTMENGLVKVVSPIDDTPAYKAGIEAGDYISEIDGEAVMGLTLSEAVDKMRGRVGTDINIQVLREGEAEPLAVTITRDLIKIKSVRSRAEKDVGYIRVTSFSENTYDGVKKAVESLSKDIGDELVGYVLDLRNNPGGLLDQAIAVSDAFLEQGEIVSTRQRDLSQTRRYSAQEGDLATGLPLVVLINKGSASASEIVAGALKDHKRAIILGQNSFGKGSVQTVIPLKGHGAMRLTTARYYTPAGTSIQATGIAPDIEVAPAKVEAIDTSLARTERDLRGHLSNTQKKKNAVKKEIKAKEEDLANKDYQLSRALDLLRALTVYKKVSGATNAPAAANLAERSAQ